MLLKNISPFHASGVTVFLRQPYKYCYGRRKGAFTAAVKAVLRSA